ncbi:MAG: hypothetical protein Q8928_09020 [Bacteroidota bacterium]|nr:hypothetical protein [Bacteroidota bacterium]
MKTMRLSITYFLCLISLPILAQNESDVLRLSQYYTGGTARGMSMGGAFGALGADMTSLSINPAGIGAYRTSEFTLTPSLNIDNTKSKFYGNNYSDSKYNLNLNNIGYVYTFNTNKDQGWVSTSLGVTYNRLSDFNRNITIVGKNTNSSMLDEFIMNANSVPGTTLNEKVNNLDYNYELLAWDTYALFYDKKSTSATYNLFLHDFKDFGYNQDVERTITTKGGIGEYAFSFGANYSHQLYLGATIGIQSVSYDELKSHSEYNNSSDYLTSFTFNDQFNVRGTGYNFKAGLIYRPIELIRIGLAFHTPTFYNLDSEFSTSMSTQFKNSPPDNTQNQTSFYSSTDVTTYSYKITTPMKTIASVALQSQYGILSLDYEFVDYTKAKVRADDYAYTTANNNIQNSFRATGNLKIGAELKAGDYAIRGGYGYYGSPYKSDQFNKDASTQSYSFGMGYRGKSFFLDFGYIVFNSTYYHKLYDYEYYSTTDNKTYVVPELSKIKSSSGRIIATLGFKF